MRNNKEEIILLQVEDSDPVDSAVPVAVEPRKKTASSTDGE